VREKIYQVIQEFDPTKDYGISIRPKEPTTPTNSHQKKKTKEDILKKIDHMHVTDGKSFKQIKDYLVQMQTDGIIPNMGYDDKEPIYFNNLWNRWKNKNMTRTG
jgi:hypothetical protein